MKKYFILLAVVTLLMSCGKTEKPTVVTTDVLQVTETTAVCAGQVESDGGAEVIARGFCWSKEQNPTIEGNSTNEGVGVGSLLQISQTSLQIPNITSEHTLQMKLEQHTEKKKALQL